MSENLLIIDADPGVDDALAILMALSRQTRHLANVLAITTVRGNVGVDQVCLNALRVLQVADRLDVRSLPTLCAIKTPFFAVRSRLWYDVLSVCRMSVCNVLYCG